MYIATRGSTVVILLAFDTTAANVALLHFILLCPIKNILGGFSSPLMLFLKEEYVC